MYKYLITIKIDYLFDKEFYFVNMIVRVACLFNLLIIFHNPFALILCTSKCLP